MRILTSRLNDNNLPLVPCSRYSEVISCTFFLHWAIFPLWVCSGVYFISQVKSEVTVSCPESELGSYYWSQGWNSSSPGPAPLSSVVSLAHSAWQLGAFLTRASPSSIAPCPRPTSMRLTEAHSYLDPCPPRHPFPWKWTHPPQQIGRR